MRRRDFGKALAASLLTTGMARAANPMIAAGQTQKTPAPRKNTMMHVGADYHVAEGDGVMSKENLEYNLRFGVRHQPGSDMVLEGEGRVRRPLNSTESQGGAFIPAESPLAEPSISIS